MAQKVISVLLNAVTGPYNTAMARASATTTGFGTAAKGASTQVGGMARSTGLLTPKLIGGAGLVFGLKKVADAAIEWEAAFADVRKTVEGTPEQLGSIETGLRKMSTQIPTSAEDLASIASSAGQLGIETEGILDFTRVIADLGETTNLAGQQGATELARFANITGMAQEDFDRLGSTIVDLGNNFETTEAEISEMALRIAGAGAQVGLAESEILALSTALSSVGIRAQAGGSSISRVMIDIASQVENSGDKLELFAEVAGMSASQFSEAWREDAAGALVAFIEGLGNMEESGGSTLQVLEELEITEIRMRDALLRASGAGDLLSEAIERGNTAWDENNALQEEAALRYETTAAKMSMAGNELKELFRTLGGPVGDLFGFGAEGLGLAVGFINESLRVAGDPSDTPEMAAARESVREFTEQRDFSGTGPADVTGPATGASVASGLTSGVPSGSVEQFERAEAALQGSFEAVVGIGRFTGGAGQSINELVGPYSNLAVAAEDALKAQEEHAEFLKAATDPVFALHRAIEGVDGAQQAYNDAVEEFGRNSPEARSAAVDLAMAVRDVELAAIDGDLSFGDFEQKLRDWVNQGVITQDEADAIRERVRLLREESERYDGEYRGSFHADTAEAEQRIRALLDQVAQIPRDIDVSVTFTADGNVIANIPGTGRIPVGSGGTTTSGGTSTGSTSPSTSTGGTSPSPGLQMHSGGIVAGTAGSMDGLARDERLRILQLGETVLPRYMDASRFAGGQSNVVNNNQQVVLQGQPDPRMKFEGRQWLKRMAA